MGSERKISVEEYRRRRAAGEFDLESPTVSSKSVVVPRAHKYGAQVTTVDGLDFPSKLEAERYLVLLDAQRRGQIYGLTPQPRFLLQPAFVYNGKRYREISCVMDFQYHVRDKDGAIHVIVEDTKGLDNPLSRLKRKLFLHRYGDTLHFRLIKSATEPVGINSPSCSSCLRGEK